MKDWITVFFFYWPLFDIGATKRAISNPFDFMTKQGVANNCKEVASSIKGVLDATDALRELCRSKIASSAVKEEGIQFLPLPPVTLIFMCLLCVWMLATQKANEKLLQETQTIAAETKASLARYLLLLW